MKPRTERLKVAVLTPYGYETASTRQRIHKNVALFPDGVEVVILSSAGPAGPRHGLRRHLPRGLECLAELGRKLAHLWVSRGFDVVVVQKNLTLFNLRGLPRLLSWLGRPVVYDFDDAVYLDSPRSFRSALLRRLSNPRQAYELMRVARVVTAGNRYLAAMAKEHNDRVHLVPTPMDTRWYRARPVRPGQAVVIGWSGSSGTNHYVMRLAPVLRRLAARFPRLEFHVISNDDRDIDWDAFAPLETRFKPFRLESLVEDLHGFDVGVMPLDDDEWSRSKCGGKILQYMACGIPPVCSPVGINVEVVEEEVNGLLAASESEWVDKLTRLLGDPQLRARLGRQARRTVVERYSNDVAAPLLLTAVEEAARP